LESSIRATSGGRTVGEKGDGDKFRKGDLKMSCAKPGKKRNCN